MATFQRAVNQVSNPSAFKKKRHPIVDWFSALKKQMGDWFDTWRCDQPVAPKPKRNPSTRGQVSRGQNIEMTIIDCREKKTVPSASKRLANPQQTDLDSAQVVAVVHANPNKTSGMVKKPAVLPKPTRSYVATAPSRDLIYANLPEVADESLPSGDDTAARPQVKVKSLKCVLF